MQSLVEPACFGGDGETGQGGNGGAGNVPLGGQQQGSSNGGGLRGLMASRDILPGDALISVPLPLLASYDYVMASDLGRVLARIPALSEEAAAVRGDLSSPL